MSSTSPLITILLDTAAKKQLLNKRSRLFSPTPPTAQETETLERIPELAEQLAKIYLLQALL